MVAEAPRVLNRRSEHIPVDNDSVYIGRGSKWGNPYRIGGGDYPINGTFINNASRDDAIRLYIYWFSPRLRLSLGELRGKNLICYCAPLACHGDWLLQEANR